MGMVSWKNYAGNIDTWFRAQLIEQALNVPRVSWLGHAARAPRSVTPIDTFLRGR